MPEREFGLWSERSNALVRRWGNKSGKRGPLAGRGFGAYALRPSARPCDIMALHTIRNHRFGRPDCQSIRPVFFMLTYVC
jgi:hypothetical protein